MKTILFCLFLLMSCTKINTNTDNTSGPPIVSDYEWSLMSKDGSPSPRKMHSATWTGSEWIVWGGILIPDPEKERELYGDGGSFNPITKKWTALSTENAAEGRFGHSAVWTGKEVIFWGGARANTMNTGGIYNPSSKTWRSMKTPDNFTDRYFHDAVWTGEKMFIWGGLHLDQGGLGSGAEYDPVTDQWELTSNDGAPTGRHHHSMNLIGRKIYIWGGLRTNEAGSAQSDGAIYDLKKRVWSPIKDAGAPSARGHHTAVYGRKKLFIWGGIGKLQDGALSSLGDGAYYNIKTETWKKMSSVNAPGPRHAHTAIWTGKKMVIWGGLRGGTVLSDGGIYDPETDTWEKLISPPKGFSNRYGATTTWTGQELYVWGGSYAVRGHAELGDGAILKFPTRELGD